METDRKVRRHHFVQPCWCINHHGWFTQPSRKGRSMSLNAGEQVQGILWDHLTCTFLYPATMKSFPHPTSLFSLNHSVWGGVWVCACTCSKSHAYALWYTWRSEDKFVLSFHNMSSGDRTHSSSQARRHVVLPLSFSTASHSPFKMPSDSVQV